MTTAVSDAPTSIQQAFAEAKTEHSTPVERAEPVEASPEPVAASTPDESAAASPDAVAAESVDSSSDLVSDAELSALQSTHADDPAALAKALKGKYTQKTQALAAERKAIADVAQHAEFLRAYKADPEATLRAEAQKLGLQIGAPVAETKAVEQAHSMADATLAQFKSALGPDLDFLADSLAPAVMKMAEQIAQQTVESSVAPLKQAQSTLVEKAAAEHTTAVMQAFEAEHPDWQQHEAAMFALSQRLQPNGMAEGEYLKTLYKLATADIRTAEAVKAATERMTKAAKTAEPRTDGTPEARVDSSSRKVSSIREAWNDSKTELARR